MFDISLKEKERERDCLKLLNIQNPVPSDKQANKPSVEITFPAVSELETKIKKTG